MKAKSAPQDSFNANDATAANSLVGEPVLPFSTITDVTEQLSTASQSIAFRSLAHSALFQAITAVGDLLVASTLPNPDELAIKRLERRAHDQAGVYHYFREEAATYAESKYDEVMSFDDMFDYVCVAAPKPNLGAVEDYDPTLLKAVGLTVQQAMEADAAQDAKDLANFETKAETLKSSKSSVLNTIAGVGSCTPDLPVAAVYRMLQKVELKLSDEPVRLWARRNKIPGAMAKMACITADLPAVSKAIKKIRDAYKGDSAVRLD